VKRNRTAAIVGAAALAGVTLAGCAIVDCLVEPHAMEQSAARGPSPALVAAAKSRSQPIAHRSAEAAASVRGALAPRKKMVVHQLAPVNAPGAVEPDAAIAPHPVAAGAATPTLPGPANLGLQKPDAEASVRTAQPSTIGQTADASAVAEYSADSILQRARNLFYRGQVLRAREVFLVLMSRARVAALLELARTYDPYYLKLATNPDDGADISRAQALYEDAKRLGAPEAAFDLERLKALKVAPM
jgi:hypothetical protein